MKVSWTHKNLMHVNAPLTYHFQTFKATLLTMAECFMKNERFVQLKHSQVIDASEIEWVSVYYSKKVIFLILASA